VKGGAFFSPTYSNMESLDDMLERGVCSENGVRTGVSLARDCYLSISYDRLRLGYGHFRLGRLDRYRTVGMPWNGRQFQREGTRAKPLRMPSD
jgi:hypothetical protein